MLGKGESGDYLVRAKKTARPTQETPLGWSGLKTDEDEDDRGGQHKKRQ